MSTKGLCRVQLCGADDDAIVIDIKALKTAGDAFHQASARFLAAKKPGNLLIAV